MSGHAGADQLVFALQDGSVGIRDFEARVNATKIAKTSSLSDIAFTRPGGDVVLTVAALKVVVQDATLAAMQVVDSFIF